MRAPVTFHGKGEAIQILLGSHHGIVRRAEREVHEERLLGGLPREVRAGLTPQQFRHVGRFFKHFGLIAPQVMEDFPRGRTQLVITMRISIEPARVPAEEVVKTLLPRAALRSAAQMPLAKGCGAVTFAA